MSSFKKKYIFFLKEVGNTNIDRGVFLHYHLCVYICNRGQKVGVTIIMDDKVWLLYEMLSDGTLDTCHGDRAAHIGKTSTWRWSVGLLRDFFDADQVRCL